MRPQQQEKKVFDMEDIIDLSQFPDRIASTFHNKTVFITGATGFVGKMLIERLLHNTDVKKIYALFKPKSGLDANARFATYFDNYMFDLLKKDRGNDVVNKVEVIPGDVSRIDLGLSPENRSKLIENTDIVYHGAAIVRFDAQISKIILLNVRGTRCMVELAKEMKHLKLFMYISTAYVLSIPKVLLEEPIKEPMNPHQMIAIAECGDEALNILTPKLLGDYSNTYPFSKALAEAIVFEQLNVLPIMVIRPSIILPCVNLPMPGFTDNVYGPVGAWILVAKGLLRVSKQPPDCSLAYIPGDMVINTMMTTTYNYIENTNNKSIVCNATNMNFDNYSMHDKLSAAIDEVCFNWPLWHSLILWKTQNIPHIIAVSLLQWFPSLLIDLLLIIIGKKPMVMGIQKKIARFDIITEKFITVDWYVKNDNIQRMQVDLNPREAASYPMDSNEMDFHDWPKVSILQIRRHILHESDDDIPLALKMRKIMYVIHVCCKWTFYVVSLQYSCRTILPLLINFLYYIFDV